MEERLQVESRNSFNCCCCRKESERAAVRDFPADFTHRSSFHVLYLRRSGEARCRLQYNEEMMLNRTHWCKSHHKL